MFEARLVGGQADPGGAWAYGRLQVFTGDFFSSVTEQMAFNDYQELGVRGVAVACRSLGFATGAQLLSGTNSGLPGQDGVVDALGVFRCMGDEDTLADCENVDYSTADGSADAAVALMCSTPSGICVTALANSTLNVCGRSDMVSNKTVEHKYSTFTSLGAVTPS